MAGPTGTACVTWDIRSVRVRGSRVAVEASMLGPGERRYLPQTFNYDRQNGVRIIARQPIPEAEEATPA